MDNDDIITNNKGNLKCVLVEDVVKEMSTDNIQRNMYRPIKFIKLNEDNKSTNEEYLAHAIGFYEDCLLFYIYPMKSFFERWYDEYYFMSIVNPKNIEDLLDKQEDDSLLEKPVKYLKDGVFQNTHDVYRCRSDYKNIILCFYIK